MPDSPNVFDRISPQVQFALFPALQRAHKEGALCIGTDHLLDGLVQVDRPLVERIFLPLHIEALRKRLGVQATGAELLTHESSHRDLPLCSELSEILSASDNLAKQFGEPRVGTRHILLELLRHEECRAATVVKECGVDLRESAEKLESSELSPEIVGLRNALAKFMGAREAEGSVTVMWECPVRLTSRRSDAPFITVVPCVRPPKALLWAPRPFLCIEIVTSEETMTSLTRRVEGYLTAGVRYVWLLSPTTKRAYTATSETGLREVKASALRTENPVLELPLAEIFS